LASDKVQILQVKLSAEETFLANNLFPKGQLPLVDKTKFGIHLK
jgi:hypothetical protein